MTWVLRPCEVAGSPARQPRWGAVAGSPGQQPHQGAGGETAPRVFRVSAGTVKTMGRSSPADFVVEEALVSRLHCRLTASEGELVVEDLQSTNGTFVNDRRVDRSLLVMGDRLRLGRAEFEVARLDQSL